MIFEFISGGDHMSKPDLTQFKHDIIQELAKQLPIFDTLVDYATCISKSEKAQMRYKFGMYLYDYIKDDQCEYLKMSTDKFRRMLYTIKDTIISCLYRYLHQQYHDSIEYFINTEMVPKEPFISSIDKYYSVYVLREHNCLSVRWCVEDEYINDTIKVLLEVFDEYEIFDSLLMQEYIPIDEYNIVIRDIIINDLDRILEDQYSEIYDDANQLYRNEQFIQKVILYDEEHRQYYNNQIGYLSYGNYSLSELLDYFCGAYIKRIMCHICKCDNFKDLLSTTSMYIGADSSIFDIITKINYYCGTSLIVSQHRYPHVIPEKMIYNE